MVGQKSVPVALDGTGGLDGGPDVSFGGWSGESRAGTGGRVGLLVSDGSDFLLVSG